MEIRFLIDSKKLTTDDMCLIEDIEGGIRPYNSWKDLLSRFLVGENEIPVDEKEARKIIGKLAMDDLVEAQRLFLEAITRKAIPPTKSAT